MCVCVCVGGEFQMKTYSVLGGERTTRRKTQATGLVPRIPTPAQTDNGATSPCHKPTPKCERDSTRKKRDPTEHVAGRHIDRSGCGVWRKRQPPLDDAWWPKPSSAPFETEVSGAAAGVGTAHKSHGAEGDQNQDWCPQAVTSNPFRKEEVKRRNKTTYSGSHTGSMLCL